MNKGRQFWLDLWHEGRTFFHRDTVNADLIKYWSNLNLPQDAQILVPLCGKSLDMLWLAEQGFQVIGIELSEKAVLQFAKENDLHFTKRVSSQAINYFSPSISIWVADIFSLSTSTIEPVDAIYDRAALIALPENLRSNYVQTCLKWLKPQGEILLKTMSYDQSQMEGPPFSVSDAEVKRLYSRCESMLCMSTTKRQIDANEPLKERGLQECSDSVWLMTG